MLHVQSASTVGRGKLIFSLGTSYYRSGETLTKGPYSLINDTSLDEADVDFHFFLSRAALTFGLSDYVEFSAALEVRNWIMQVGDDDEVKDVFETRTRGGIGDTDAAPQDLSAHSDQVRERRRSRRGELPDGAQGSRLHDRQDRFRREGAPDVQLSSR